MWKELIHGVDKVLNEKVKDTASTKRLGYIFLERNGHNICTHFWKHSLNLVVEKNAKQTNFFHHEFAYSDFKLVDVFRWTEKYIKQVALIQEIKMFLSCECLILDHHQE